MEVVTTLTWTSVFFAGLAAGFWFWSAAAVPLPKRITTAFGGVGGTAQVLGDKLRAQAWLSALGAFCAGLAAGSQAVALAIGA